MTTAVSPGQGPLLAHVLCQHGDDLVAVDLVALFVHCQAAVRVAVKGHAAVEPVLHHILRQIADVGGAAALVDVHAVRLHADEMALGPEAGKQQLRRGRRRAVGAVDGHPQPGEVCLQAARQILHIVLHRVLAAGDPAHPGAGGQLDLGLVAHQVLDLILHLVGSL